MKQHTVTINGEECISGVLFIERANLCVSTFTLLVKLGEIKYKMRGLHKYYPVSQLATYGGK